MCTVVLLKRSGHPWPVVIAANRDEQVDRPWDLPSAWWADRPGVVGGRDRTGSGTWMGLNRHRVVAVVLNRQGSLGPARGKRSRGDLPLLALEHRSAPAAAAAIARLQSALWRPFNMVVADATGAVIFLRSLGAGQIKQVPLPDGLHMITSSEPNDMERPRVARHFPLFQAAPPVGADDLSTWQTLITDRSGGPDEQLHIVPRQGYGTVCSSVLALPRQGEPVWQFTASSDPASFAPMTLSASEGRL